MNNQVGNSIISAFAQHVSSIPNLFKYPLTPQDIYEVIYGMVILPDGIDLAEWIHFRNLYCSLQDEYVDIATYKIVKKPILKKGIKNERLHICSSKGRTEKYTLIENYMKSRQPDDVPEEDLPDPNKLAKEIKTILRRLEK